MGRDSKAKRLGTKVTAGQKVKAGAILVRQRGTKIHPGLNTRKGGDDTVYAVKPGVIGFISIKVRKFNGQLKRTKFVKVS